MIKSIELIKELQKSPDSIVVLIANGGITVNFSIEHRNGEVYPVEQEIN